MKVILLTDVKNVGKKGDVKEVADGYGRNFLVRNGLAVESSKKSLEILSQQKQQEAQEYAEKQKEAEMVKERIEKETLKFSVKTGNDGKMFGSISSAKIAETLLNQYNIVIDKRKFVGESSITKLGKHQLKVELFKNVIANINIEVEAE